MGDTYCGDIATYNETGDLHLSHVKCVAPEAEPACFPANAQVALPKGWKSISELEIGDRVLVSPGIYSEIVMFTHRDSAYKGRFVELVTQSSTLQLTHGHYIYSNGNLLPAGNVKTGDLLRLSDGTVEPVIDVRSVINTGLYNPQTAHGDIVVDGLVTSTYTTFVDPSSAHTLLAPIRSMFRSGAAQSLDALSNIFGTVSA